MNIDKATTLNIHLLGTEQPESSDLMSDQDERAQSIALNLIPGQESMASPLSHTSEVDTENHSRASMKVVWADGEYLGQVNPDLIPHGMGLLTRADKIIDGIFQEGYPDPEWTYCIRFQGETDFHNYRGGINQSFQRHGKNTLTELKDGTTLKGNYRNDTPYGSFKIVFSDESELSFYHGSINAQGKPHGFGTFTLRSGKTIRGLSENGHLQGRACLYDNYLHTKYAGPLDSQYRKHGLGIFTQENGDSFEGNFFEDQYDGCFLIRTTDSTTHLDISLKGDLDRDGKKQGEFNITKHHVLAQGNFIDNYPVGEFSLVFWNKLVWYYTGEVDININPIQGTLSDMYGHQFKGAFMNGIPDKGVMIFDNGTTFEGEGDQLYEAYFNMLESQIDSLDEEPLSEAPTIELNLPLQPSLHLKRKFSQAFGIILPNTELNSSNADAKKTKLEEDSTNELLETTKLESDE